LVDKSKIDNLIMHLNCLKINITNQ
jgi:hypothetical protein